MQLRDYFDNICPNYYLVSESFIDRLSFSLLLTEQSPHLFLSFFPMIYNEHERSDTIHLTSLLAITF